MKRACAWHPLFVGAPQQADIAYIMHEGFEPMAERVKRGEKLTHGACSVCLARMIEETLDGREDQRSGPPEAVPPQADGTDPERAAVPGLRAEGSLGKFPRRNG